MLLVQTILRFDPSIRCAAGEPQSLQVVHYLPALFPAETCPRGHSIVGFTVGNKPREFACGSLLCPSARQQMHRTGTRAAVAVQFAQLSELIFSPLRLLGDFPHKDFLPLPRLLACGGSWNPEPGLEWDRKRPRHPPPLPNIFSFARRLKGLPPSASLGIDRLSILE